MDRSKLLQQLDEILGMNPGTLTGTEELSQLESWDSLAMMNFIAFASDETGVTLSPRQISRCETVDELLKLVEPK